MQKRPRLLFCLKCLQPALNETHLRDCKSLLSRLHHLGFCLKSELWPGQWYVLKAPPPHTRQYIMDTKIFPFAFSVTITTFYTKRSHFLTFHCNSILEWVFISWLPCSLGAKLCINCLQTSPYHPYADQ